MDERANARKRPVNWKDPEVIEALGLNLETLIELTDKSVESVAVAADVPTGVVQACLAGTIKDPSYDHLVAIANVFGVVQSKLEELARAEFKSEEEREAHWRSHLRVNSLIRGDDYNGNSDSEEDAEGVDDPADTDSGPKPHELEPVWDEAGLVATLGDKTFDLKGKDCRRSLMGHIRSAADGRHTLAAIVKVTKEGRASGWFSSVEKGQSRIYRHELEAIAGLLEISIGVLLTGHGLKPVKIASNRKVDHSGVFDSLPTFSTKEWEGYFMSRVMSQQVELGENVTTQNLMEVILKDRAGEAVDWGKAFMSLTADGNRVCKHIETVAGQLGKMAPQIQVLVLSSVADILWSDAGGDDA